MSTGKLSRGLLFALAAAITAGAVYATLGPLLGGARVLRALLALLAFAYLLFLFRDSAARAGRVSAVAGWLVCAAMLWLLPLPLGLYLTAHAGLIWLIRSLLRYRSLFSAFLDLVLTGLGLAASIWAAAQIGSVAAAVWTFFLLQTLHLAIPAAPGARAIGDPGDPDFQRACRNAEAAVRRIHSRP